MLFYSTRDKNNRLPLHQAILQGLASDGGLFVPEYFPQIKLNDLDPQLTYAQFATHILKAYFTDDSLSPAVATICHQAFNFPLVFKPLNDNTTILELFHGPTLSFKDFGARFLAQCLGHLNHEPRTILVATSGDTGSAVASAFHAQPNTQVVIMFPEGQISQRQQQQITCWGENILALAVDGTFDDCQKIVKQAFHEPWWHKRGHLSSANSINIARLLAQLTYYAYSSWQFCLQHQQSVGYVIPTGNVGNSTAAFWAKAMGFPIREIVLATNANRVISHYIDQGKFTPQASIATLANAMDVGNPSNFERLTHLYDTHAEFKAHVRAFSCSDEAIRQAIISAYRQFNYILCPHSATAYFARQKLSTQPWIITATAAAAKFETILEPLLGLQLPLPEQLQALLHKPTHLVKVSATMAAVQQAVSQVTRP